MARKLSCVAMAEMFGVSLPTINRRIADRKKIGDGYDPNAIL